MSSAYFRTTEHVVSCQHIREYPHATLNSQEDVLRLAVKHYQPLDNPDPKPGDVTLIGAHATAFPKELYEPLWDELFLRSRSEGFRIRGIWIADVCHQGASGILNEDRLGNDPSWYDHARDLLGMINYFRNDMPRPLVGIGHSLGAANLTELSLIHPRLLTGLVLLDPTFQRFSTSPAEISSFRRDLWPSRSAAQAAAKKNKFFANWDERVMHLWVQHGYRALPTPLYPEAKVDDSGLWPVTLTTTKLQEVATYVRPNFRGVADDGRVVIDPRATPDLDPSAGDFYPFYRPESLRLWQNLPYIRPSVLYIFGGDSEMSSDYQRYEKLSRTGIGVGGSGGMRVGKVRGIVLDHVGHLVAMEAVNGCADAIGSWLAQELRRWKEEEDELDREWRLQSVRERTTISDEWKQRIRRKDATKTSTLKRKL